MKDELKTKKKTIAVIFEGVKYKIDIEKLLYIIRVFKNNKRIEFKNKAQMIKLIEECSLFDEVFLEKVSIV